MCVCGGDIIWYGVVASPWQTVLSAAPGYTIVGSAHVAYKTPSCSPLCQ